MACNNITSGIPLGCEKIMGGLKKVAIANIPSGITSVTDYITFEVDGAVSGWTGGFSGEFYLYETEELSSNILENLADSGNRAGGWLTTASLVFAGLTNEKRTTMDNLSNSRYIIVGYYNNGEIKIYGTATGFYTSNIDVSSGTGLSDIAGYTLEAKASDKKSAYHIDGSLITLI